MAHRSIYMCWWNCLNLPLRQPSHQSYHCSQQSSCGTCCLTAPWHVRTTGLSTSQKRKTEASKTRRSKESQIQRRILSFDGGWKPPTRHFYPSADWWYFSCLCGSEKKRDASVADLFFINSMCLYIYIYIQVAYLNTVLTLYLNCTCTWVCLDDVLICLWLNTMWMLQEQFCQSCKVESGWQRWAGSAPL